MTRRIVIAILLTVGAMLLLSDAITYWTIRQALVDDLDQNILARVAFVPQIMDTSAARQLIIHDARDRYVIENAQGQNYTQPALAPDPTNVTPQIISAHFTNLADGQPYRTLTIRARAFPPSGEGSPVPVTVVYSGSADHLYSLLHRLIWSLLLANIFIVTGASLVVRRVSAAALKPLHQAGQVIGTIDEKNLDRRIAVADLPSELTPVGERLNEMLARLEESLTRRRRFLADASHELRAPVAALMTSLEVCLRRERTAEAYRDVLEDCLANTRMLRSLVDTLMEHVKSEIFQNEHAFEPMDVHALFSPCVALAAAIGAPHDVSVIADIGPAPCISSSAERLRSILINVLTNAVEYNSRPGRVTLVVRCTENALDILVTDTGPGIPASELPRLTEPFYRLEKSRKPGGHHLGLGLFLVESHLHALKGTISIESELGKGTSVHITVPTQQVDPAVASPPEKKPLMQRDAAFLKTSVGSTTS